LTADEAKPIEPPLIRQAYGFLALALAHPHSTRSSKN
jgi:hypothetical protein